MTQAGCLRITPSGAQNFFWRVFPCPAQKMSLSTMAYPGDGRLCLRPPRVFSSASASFSLLLGTNFAGKKGRRYDKVALQVFRQSKQSDNQAVQVAGVDDNDLPGYRPLGVCKCKDRFVVRRAGKSV